MKPIKTMKEIKLLNKYKMNTRCMFIESKLFSCEYSNCKCSTLARAIINLIKVNITSATSTYAFSKKFI